MAFREDRGWSRLLHPISPATFFAEHYDRKPLYIPGRPDKFADLFDLDAYYASLGQVELKAGLLNRAGHHEELVIQPREVEACYASGMTICLGAVHESHEPLSRLLTDIKRETVVAGEFRVNCYYSPDQAGFGTHFDNRAVWVMQIEGEKEWRHSPERAFDAPTNLVAMGPGRLGAPWEDIAPPDESQFVSTHLKPGDLLYLPSGTWHCPRGIGRSLALSMYVTSMSAHQLLMKTLEPILCADAAWRREMPCVEVDALASGEMPAVLRQVLRDRLADIQAKIATLDVDRLATTWYENLTTRGLEPGHRRPAARGQLGRGDRIDVVEGALTFLRTGEDVVIHFHPPAAYTHRPAPADLPREIVIEASALPFLRRLATTRSFEAHEAMYFSEEGYSWEDVEGVIDALVEAGALRVTPDL
jgi:ribosomal protein L16 Arg81 hydroxylase